MLVLSRKRFESIILNPGTPDAIVITVVDVRGDKVRLGVDAPDHVTAHRLEVAEAIAREEAAGQTPRQKGLPR